MVNISGRFDVFHALSADKQERIVSAALREFASKGFKRASTNAIAESAGIGKGMLFYYFGSKEELFDFLCEYTIEFARSAYIAEFKPGGGDFLERYVALTQIKRAAMAANPLPVAFFKSFFQGENEGYFDKYVADTSALREQIFANLYDGIDYSLFREDIDGKSAVKYIKWLFDSYETDAAERVKRGELVLSSEDAVSAEWRRFDEFTSDIKRLFYKERA